MVKNNPAARRNRRHSTIRQIGQRWETEDELVRTCAEHSSPLALAYEIALELLRRSDAELPSIPEGSWVYLVSKNERDELGCCLNLIPSCADTKILAEKTADRICEVLPSDEAFLVAMQAFRPLRARTRL
jgi:hypothetical protein